MITNIQPVKEVVLDNKIDYVCEKRNFKLCKISVVSDVSLYFGEEGLSIKKIRERGL